MAKNGPKQVGMMPNNVRNLIFSGPTPRYYASKKLTTFWGKYMKNNGTTTLRGDHLPIMLFFEDIFGQTYKKTLPPMYSN